MKGQACPKCPSSDAYFQYPDHGHCYSCGYHHKDWDGEIKSSLELKKKEPNYVELPFDFEYNLPYEVHHWLGRYNITSPEIRDNKLGWSEHYKCLVLPIFHKETRELQLYQMRYFGDDPKMPKYRTIGAKTALIHLPQVHKNDDVVIVEDIISSIKVSRVTNCFPLFGSSMPLPLAIAAAKRFKRATSWLDSDKRAESARIALALSDLGMTTKVIFTDKDPKEYGTADIREFLAQ